MTNKKWQTLLQTIVLATVTTLTPISVNAQDAINIQRQSDKAPAQTSQFAGLVGN